jgi:DNA primase
MMDFEDMSALTALEATLRAERYEKLALVLQRSKNMSTRKSELQDRLEQAMPRIQDALKREEYKEKTAHKLQVFQQLHAQLLEWTQQHKAYLQQQEVINNVEEAQVLTYPNFFVFLHDTGQHERLPCSLISNIADQHRLPCSSKSYVLVAACKPVQNPPSRGKGYENNNTPAAA